MSFLDRRKGTRDKRRQATDSPADDRWVARNDAALSAVERLLLKAEETFPAGEDVSLGTWFARVQETLAIVSRICIKHLEAGNLLSNRAVADEIVVAFGDTCAESTRAMGWLSGGETARANQATLQLLWQYESPIGEPGWVGVMETIARCSAALEPISNGLRDGDVSVAEVRETGDDEIVPALFEVARHAYRQVYALCA